MRRLNGWVVASLLVVGCSDAADVNLVDPGKGSIEGMVWAPSGATGDTAPVGGANVLVYRSPCPPGPEVCTALAAIAAQTVTDSSGRYTLGGLQPDTYTAVVNPPPNTLLNSATTTINVSAGQVVHRSFTVTRSNGTVSSARLFVYGLSAVAPGKSGTIYASILNANGDSTLNAVVSWMSRSPTVATVAGTTQHATVTGVALGTTWIVASSGGLSDSISLAVRADSSTDSTATPHDTVATVTITPATQTKAIGDSIGFYAATRGANGLIVSGYAVTWTSSNAAIGTLQQYSTSALLKAVAKGTTTITATSGGKSGTATVIIQ